MFLYEKKMLSLFLYVATTPKQLMNCLVGTSWGFCLPCFPCDLEKTFWHQVHLVSCMFQIVLESSSIDYYFYVLFNYLKTQRIVFVFHFSLHWLLLWSILKIFRSKRLWLDGFQKLSSVLTLKELSDLQEVMRDKELNIRTDIYEILLQDETDTWLNVSLVCSKLARFPGLLHMTLSAIIIFQGFNRDWFYVAVFKMDALYNDQRALGLTTLPNMTMFLVFLPSVWTLLLVTPVIWFDTFLLEVQKGLHWALDKMNLER